MLLGAKAIVKGEKRACLAKGIIPASLGTESGFEAGRIKIAFG
jgi:hypothetical protein